MERILSALPPLCVTLFGVAFGWLWINADWWVPIIPLAFLVMSGLAAKAISRRFLLPEHPVAAVRLMEWWIVTPGALGALATGLLIVLAVETAPQKSWSEERKQLAAAAVGALSAFVTTTLIKDAEDADVGWVGALVKSAFHDCYKRDEPGLDREPRVVYFPAGSQGERWVYSDPYQQVEGWGRSARIKRAKGVQGALG